MAIFFEGSSGEPSGLVKVRKYIFLFSILSLIISSVSLAAVAIPSGCRGTYDSYKVRGSYDGDYPGARLWAFDKLYSDVKKGFNTCAHDAFKQAVKDSEQYWNNQAAQSCKPDDKSECTTTDPKHTCCWAKSNLSYLSTRKSQIQSTTGLAIAPGASQCAATNAGKKNRNDIMNVAISAVPAPKDPVKDPCEDLRKMNPEIITSFDSNGKAIPAKQSSAEYVKDCALNFLKAVGLSLWDMAKMAYELSPPGQMMSAVQKSWMKWKDPSYKSPDEELAALLWEYKSRPADLMGLIMKSISSTIDSKLQNFSCLNDFGKWRYVCENMGTVVGIFLPPAGALKAIFSVARGGKAGLIAVREGVTGLKSVARFAEEGKAAAGAMKTEKLLPAVENGTGPRLIGDGRTTASAHPPGPNARQREARANEAKWKEGFSREVEERVRNMDRNFQTAETDIQRALERGDLKGAEKLVSDASKNLHPDKFSGASKTSLETAEKNAKKIGYYKTRIAEIKNLPRAFSDFESAAREALRSSKVAAHQVLRNAETKFDMQNYLDFPKEIQDEVYSYYEKVQALRSTLKLPHTGY